MQIAYANMNCHVCASFMHEFVCGCISWRGFLVHIRCFITINYLAFDPIGHFFFNLADISGSEEIALHKLKLKDRWHNQNRLLLSIATSLTSMRFMKPFTSQPKQY